MQCQRRVLNYAFMFWNSKQNVHAFRGRVNYSCIYNAFYLTFLRAFFVWVISQGKYVVCKELGACTRVRASTPLCAMPAWKILEGRLETKIGKERKNNPAELLLPRLFTEMKMIYFHWFPRFHWSWVQERENNMSQCCRSSANFASGLICNTPLLSSNSRIGLIPAQRDA